MRVVTILGLVAVVGGSTAIASAQVASAQLREDEQMPGAAAGQIVTSISNSAVNGIGGYAFTSNTSDGAATLSHVWGNLAGGAGSPLRTEGTFGDFTQTSFEGFFGIGNTMTTYGATDNNDVSGETGLDSVWQDSTRLLGELDPVASLPGFFSTFNSRPNSTWNDIPVWVGGISDSEGGPTQNRVLFKSGGAVIKGGDNVGGVVEPIEPGSSGIGFDFRFSEMGNNYILDVLLDSTTADDGLIVVDGNGLTAGGALLRENTVIPPSVGGIGGEAWDNFDFLGINEAGNTFVTGDTNGATATDEFVFKNDKIVQREGDAVNSFFGPGIISGSIEGGYMNASGDWSVIWDVTTDGTNREVLIINGEVILSEGQKVDWNNDGIPDDNAILENFTGLSSLTMSDRDEDDVVCVAFTADIDVDGATLEGGFLLKYTIPAPGSVALLGLAGLVGLRRRR